MPTFNIVFTLVCLNGVMEPNEWQKYKNKKSTEYTQKITSQARIAEEQQLEGLNDSEGYDYMLSKLNLSQRKQM